MRPTTTSPRPPPTPPLIVFEFASIDQVNLNPISNHREFLRHRNYATTNVDHRRTLRLEIVSELIAGVNIHSLSPPRVID